MTGPSGLNRVRDLFSRAMELPRAEHPAFLAAHCADDPEIRKEVESLLDHQGDWDQLGTATHIGDAESVIEHVIAANPSERIGNNVDGFVLREVLGEGGMGTVYLADQISPVERQVALKIIKQGMDSRHVIARFERERQSLAMMDHPGIARVFGAGSTETGSPYFAMELVRGQKITTYCDTHKLKISERLTLFASLCDAVQHAHQKGVIHRDLKPSNVLVADVSGTAVPKVIDFGIAKPADGLFSEHSLHTTHGQILGTPEYMSPEQADASEAAIDTRTDIYSLGVILFELLTGVVPFERKGDGSRWFAKLIEDICESPAPKPSSKAADPHNPTHASGERRSIRRSLQGDLDWITLKSLQKCPDDRYPSADLLARDIRAHLEDRPVFASPPRFSTSIAKFTRRNKALVAAVVVVMISLAGGAAAVGSGLLIARQQRDIARLEAETAYDISEFLTNMLASIDPDEAQGETVTVEHVLLDATRRLERGELSSQPGVQARLRTVMGRCYIAIGRYEEALAEHREAVRLTQQIYGTGSIESAAALEWLASSQTVAGAYADAEANFEQAITIRRKVGGSTLPADSATTLGSVYFWTGRYEDSERFFRMAIDELGQADPSKDPRVGDMMSLLGVTLEVRGETDESIRWHRRALEAHRAVYGNTHTAVSTSLNNLANALEAKGDYAGAKMAHEESLAIKRKLLPSSHPDIATSQNNLALVLIRTGDPQGAERLLRAAIATRRTELGLNHASTGVAYLNLGLALRDQERFEDAFEAFTTAISIADRAVGPQHLMGVAFRIHLGHCLAKLGRFDDAEQTLLDSYGSIVGLLGSDHRRAVDARRYLVELYESWDRPEDAKRWQAVNPTP